MATESDSPHESVLLAGDYRLSRTGNGIKIEVLDYHAEPLVLTRKQLRELIGAERDH